jgi:pimeloyl-ACP methyl ester carboxylesterase
MSDFVLVHGAWHGAWCWKRIVAPLWAAGHRAFCVTLTGSGERAHLLSPSITLDTHIADVINVIDAEELLDPILVGHSYAGLIITGVANRLGGRLQHLVYVDAVVPRPGDCWSTDHAADTQIARRQAIVAHGALPPPDPTLYGLAGDDRAWVARRLTPFPGSVYDIPLDFDAAKVAALPRTFIDCTSPALPTIAAPRLRVRAEPGWQVVDIPTGHDAMVSAPQRLLDALLRAGYST